VKVVFPDSEQDWEEAVVTPAFAGNSTVLCRWVCWIHHPEVGMKNRLVVATVPDREGVVVEPWAGDEMWCEARLEDDQPQLQVYGRPGAA
jgi:hypothetical protein